ncbi:MAG: hypothetical protein M3R68_02555 [Acidobacteriota bacterium]|nr:hypothetical protein [Acidobacteriota bacterium]
MKIKFALAFLSLLLVSSIHALASTTSERLSHMAISENPAEAGPAISELRSMGPAGFTSLLLVHGEEIQRHIANPLEPATPEWLRLSAALDTVSQQRDSYLSRLYWYTDLSQAEAAAKSSGKPILSLRLLGNLNEEFSCANSRFFRTVIYSNADVSKALRERFILHWQSVRPAPRVTIDFGDGRKLERTLTGNSIHYVLDPEGRVIDALPGLYGPDAFLSSLSRAEDVGRRLAGLTGDARQQWLADYHQAAVKSITAAWLEDARRAGGRIPESLLPKSNGKGTRAVDIAPLAVTKGITEFSILQAITRDADSLKAVTDEATWTRIAWRHIADARLDEQSIGLVRRQMESLWAQDQTGPKPEVKIVSLLQKFQQSIALDTVRNEYMLHTKVHAWLASGLVRDDVETFNEKVYAELFLTPKSDPWLGLFSDDTYVGLQNGGVVP